jgi:signal transduction histidine kinase
VVQESLTNVVRHAAASTAVIEIAYLAEDLRVTITDDGVGGRVEDGFGITGMRERVLATGGVFEAGPTDNGGFRVLARIPIEPHR